MTINTNQRREPSGTNVGGQFAPQVNPESTLVLPPEPSAEPPKGRQVYFVAVYDEATRTWGEDPEYMREGQQVYDNARNDGNWEPWGAHGDLVAEAANSFKARLIGTGPSPTEFDSQIAQYQVDIAEIQKEYEDTYEDADYDDLIDLKKGIIERHEEIDRLQRMEIEAQRVLIERLQANQSSFDLEAAVAERVISTIECDAQADMTQDEAHQVEQMVGDYFASDQSRIFENGLGGLLDREADEFIKAKKSALDGILGEDEGTPT